MKRRLLIVFAFSLLLPLAALFWPLETGVNARAPKTPSASFQQTASLSAAQERRDLSNRLMRVPKDEETLFWLSAVVPEPVKPRLPSATILRGRPSAPDAALKTAARIRQIESSPVTPDNLRLYNQQAVLFYDQDATAATDWLNSTEGFEHLGPALASIAASLGERGQIDLANLIVETIPNPDARRTAVLDIYALRVRNGQVTRDQLAQAGWDAADIDFIFENKGD